MPTVSIDNIEYELDSLSTDAKNQFASMQFVDQKLAQLDAEIAVYRTARIGYSKALKEALPEPKGKKAKH
jgi:hypothetical protein